MYSTKRVLLFCMHDITKLVPVSKSAPNSLNSHNVGLRYKHCTVNSFVDITWFRIAENVTHITTNTKEQYRCHK